MKHSEEQINCEAFLLQVDAYLDGILAEADADAFRLHLDACPECEEALVFAREVVGELRALPMLRCPDAIVEAAWARVAPASEGVVERMRRWVDEQWSVLLRPSLTAATLAALVAFAAYLRPIQPAPEAPQTAEVTRAIEELKWTLGYISQVGRQTGFIVRDQVIEPHVLGPIETAIERIERKP